MNTEPRLEDISDYNGEDIQKNKSVLFILVTGLLIILSYLTIYTIDLYTPNSIYIVKKH